MSTLLLQELDMGNVAWKRTLQPSYLVLSPDSFPIVAWGQQASDLPSPRLSFPITMVGGGKNGPRLKGLLGGSIS